MESARLRVEDIDVAQLQIKVRDKKGVKDRRRRVVADAYHPPIRSMPRRRW